MSWLQHIDHQADRALGALTIYFRFGIVSRLLQRSRQQLLAARSGREPHSVRRAGRGVILPSGALRHYGCSLQRPAESLYPDECPAAEAFSCVDRGFTETWSACRACRP